MKIHEKVLHTLTPLVVVGALAGCGGGDGGDAAGGAAGGGATEAPFDMATAGHVTGMVMFEGTAPADTPIDMTSEPTCAAKHATPAMTESFKVSAGHLGDVFVYVKEGLEGMSFPVPAEATLINQDGCQYLPHVSGVMVNQTLTFQNSDGLLHNISASPTVNRGFNITQPVNMTTDRTLAQPEVMVPIQCDVHGWMNSYVGVVAHPYHAVSNAGGTFDLRNLPPGEYVLEAWHSRLGTQEATVTVATGQTATVSFSFTEAMLANAVVPLGEPIDPHFHTPEELAAAGYAPAVTGADQ
ncbi:MAG: carboxypeptidase regulatory-like domain-containing protein [Gemmatimonadota bacterium]